MSSIPLVDFSHPDTGEYVESQQKREVTSKKTSNASPLGHSFITRMRTMASEAKPRPSNLLVLSLQQKGSQSQPSC